MWVRKAVTSFDMVQTGSQASWCMLVTDKQMSRFVTNRPDFVSICTRGA
eukprot:CAMPEP_0182593788 /NCGR_PEP_ID=MMETSP1324-20130603/78819_1 /TAXON_ID=236786 /ORGANISM="Florenciella sp., Strain RCC1587" /LENGTH=48 /DNA_ID= /DNA_START= /DNA_END= /DNA_ORIENTATION=